MAKSIAESATSSTTVGEDSLFRPNIIEPALFIYPLAHMALETYNGMLAVMWPLFVSRFGLAFSSIGLLTMVFRGSMTLPQIGFASLADKFGSRWLAIGGLLCMAVFMSFVGLSPSLLVLVVILAIAPLGSAAFHPAGTAYMGRSLPYRRATAVAIFMIGGTVGMSIAPLLAAQIYGRFGLAASPVFLPLGLIVAVLMFFFLRADRPHADQHRVQAGPAVAVPTAVFLLMAVPITQAWMETGLQSYLTTLLTGRGESLVLASQALFAYSACAAGGLFLGGALADRVARWKVIALSQILIIPFYAGAVLLSSHWLILAAAGMGFVLSLSAPVTVVLAQELMPTRTSLASALTMGISWVLGTVGVVLTGMLADHIGLQSALALNTVLPIIGVTGILCVRQLGRRAPAA